MVSGFITSIYVSAYPYPIVSRGTSLLYCFKTLWYYCKPLFWKTNRAPVFNWIEYIIAKNVQARKS